MGNVLLMAQGLGAGMNVAGSYYGARGQKSALEFQAQVDEINAGMARGRMRDARRAGELAEQDVRMTAARTKSAARAAMGANGVDLSAGVTPAAALSSTDLMTEWNVREIEIAEIYEAFGHAMEAEQLRGRARSSRAAASSISPGMSAFTTLLGEATNVASSWYMLKEAGAIGGGAKSGRPANQARARPGRSGGGY